MNRLVCTVVLALAVLGPGAGASRAHEVRPGYLELRETAPDRYEVLWKVPARGDDQRLGLHLRLPEDCRFLAPPHATLAGGAFVERSTVNRPGGLAGREIRIDGLAATRTDVLVRIERHDGSVQVTRLTPDRPSFVVATAPRRVEVVRTYLRLGVEHILFGIDHLFFVLGLVMLVDGARRRIGTVTAFTAAHSLTLTAATLGFVRVPGPPVEAMIALSIVFVAGEIAHRRQGRVAMTARWPWMVAFTFGLLHGFGFAGALHDIGLPEHAIPLALACFNAGVEVGQLLFIGGVLLLGALAGRAGDALRARGVALPSPAAWHTAGAYVIGSLAASWLIERTVAFFA